MRLRNAYTVLIFLLIGLLSGCAHSHKESSHPVVKEGELLIVNAYAHAAIPGSNNSAAYITVLNGLDEFVTLTAVQTTIASSAMLHETVRDENDLLRMEPRPDGFKIPMGDSLFLEPGGKHIMLTDLQVALEAETEFEMVVRFEGADDQTIMVSVISLQDSTADSVHNH